MKDAQPAHLAVVNPPWTMGHNVVVDGYNTDEFYHINFGWGGTYNGWYHIPDDIPYGLTVIEGLIVDILTEESTHPVLSCTGSLSWGLVQPGETLTSTLLLSNAGEPESLLDWSVISHPSWGTWSITPSFGYDLTPEHGGCFPSLGSLKATFRLGMLIWVLKIVFVKRVFPSNESITSQATDN